MLTPASWSDLQLTSEQEDRAQRLCDEAGHDPYVAIVFTRAIVLMQDSLLKGWSGYAWKDGQYVDSIQEYFDRALAGGDT